jgi:hypothetical protein
MTTMPSSTSPLATSSETMVGLRSYHFRLDGLRNSEALEHAGLTNAASDSEISNGLRIEQCALECVNRTDVGPARARAHFDADTRALCRGRLSIGFALFDPPIDGRRPADQDVERIAGVGASLEMGGFLIQSL